MQRSFICTLLQLYTANHTLTSSAPRKILTVHTDTDTRRTTPLPNIQRAEVLFLAALLLRRDDPEVAVGGVVLGRLGLRGALLRDLAPAAGGAAGRVGGAAALGRRGGVDEALVGELLAADELLGKVARVDRAAAAVDGFGDELGFGGEEDEVGDELLGW